MAPKVITVNALIALLKQFSGDCEVYFVHNGASDHVKLLALKPEELDKRRTFNFSFHKNDVVCTIENAT